MPPRTRSNSSAPKNAPSNEKKRKLADKKDVEEKNVKKPKVSESTQAEASQDSEKTLEEAEREVLAHQRTFYRAQADLETRKLRSTQMPEIIKPFLNSISVYVPAQVTTIQRNNGANYSTMAFNSIKTVYRIGNSDDANSKLLDVEGEYWISSHEDTQACQLAVDVWYESPGGKEKRHGSASVKYFDTLSDCPYGHVSKGIKEIMLDVVSDMGYSGEVEDEELVRFLYLLLGVMRRHVMRQSLCDGPHLYEIIRDDLKVEERM